MPQRLRKYLDFEGNVSSCDQFEAASQFGEDLCNGGRRRKPQPEVESWPHWAARPVQERCRHNRLQDRYFAIPRGGRGPPDSATVHILWIESSTTSNRREAAAE